MGRREPVPAAGEAAGEAAAVGWSPGSRPHLERTSDAAARVLMVVNAHTRLPPANGLRPIRDFEVYQAALGATVVDLDDVAHSRVASLLSRRVGQAAGLGWLALRALAGHSVVYCDAESIGLPLALIARVLRPPARVFMLVHRPEGGIQRFFFRWLLAGRAAAGFFVFGPAVAERLSSRLRTAPSKLHVLPIGVDTTFWKPMPASEGASARPYICSAGLEYRDYPTLVRASEGLGVDVLIAAQSPYSVRHNTLDDVALPEHVRPVDVDVLGLRELYAGAAVVVVPLQDVEFPAGLTTIIEGMAAGKCVVVSRSMAQAELITDRRAALRKDDSRSTSGGLVRFLSGEKPDPAHSGATGFYSAVGDIDDLHRSLRYLLDHTEVRAEMGARARREAVTYFDHHVVAARLQEVLRGT